MPFGCFSRSRSIARRQRQRPRAKAPRYDYVCSSYCFERYSRQIYKTIALLESLWRALTNYGFLPNLYSLIFKKNKVCGALNCQSYTTLLIECLLAGVSGPEVREL